jgi:hypothetical protein
MDPPPPPPPHHFSNGPSLTDFTWSLIEEIKLYQEKYQFLLKFCVVVVVKVSTLHGEISARLTGRPV